MLLTMQNLNMESQLSNICSGYKEGERNKEMYKGIQSDRNLNKRREVNIQKWKEMEKETK